MYKSLALTLIFVISQPVLANCHLLNKDLIQNVRAIVEGQKELIPFDSEIVDVPNCRKARRYYSVSLELAQKVSETKAQALSYQSMCDNSRDIQILIRDMKNAEGNYQRSNYFTRIYIVECEGQGKF